MSKVESSGPKNAKIMVVGEAPGAREEIEGKPFVGPAGSILRDYLYKAGIDPTEVRYSNICKYRPPNNKIAAFFDAEGRPNAKIIEGLQELQDEILEVSPNVVMVCGSHPLAMLCGKGKWKKTREGNYYTGIMDWRGSIIDCQIVPGQKIVPTFHPSYILQEGFKDHGIWQCDIQRIKEQSEFPEINLEASRKSIFCNPRGDERHAARAQLLSSGLITFDIEYIGSSLLCVGMTDHRDRAWVFGIESPDDVLFCKEILLSGIPLNAQNSMFDCSILEYHYNIPCMQFLKYDTMLAAHAANIELPKGLDFLCSIYTDQPYYKDMINWDLVKKGKQSMDVVYRYNGIDVWTQHQVMEEQIKWEFQLPRGSTPFYV